MIFPFNQFPAAHVVVPDWVIPVTVDTHEAFAGVANVIVTPALFDRSRFALLGSQFLLIDGALQNVDHVVSVKAARVEALSARVSADVSHDFH